METEYTARANFRARGPRTASMLWDAMNDDGDTELARRARGGDRAAFEELVRRTSRLLFARLYLETGRRDRAEDLLQETYLAAFRAIGQLSDPARVRSWLGSIADRVAIDAARRDSRLKRTPPAEARREAANGPGPGEALERREARERALGVLRSMPEEYRLPLLMRYLGGADYGTMSLHLGLSNGSLRGLLHRGLELLRAEMRRASPREALGG